MNHTIISAQDKLIFVESNGRVSVLNDTTLAAGRAYAAAPDLLAALKSVEAEGRSSPRLMTIVRAAIAKAEGR